MVICAAGAALSFKLPALFGLSLDDDAAFYVPELHVVHAALAGGVPGLATAGLAPA